MPPAPVSNAGALAQGRSRPFADGVRRDAIGGIVDDRTVARYAGPATRARTPRAESFRVPRCLLLHASGTTPRFERSANSGGTGRGAEGEIKTSRPTGTACRRMQCRDRTQRMCRLLPAADPGGRTAVKIARENAAALNASRRWAMAGEVEQHRIEAAEASASPNRAICAPLRPSRAPADDGATGFEPRCR